MGTTVKILLSITGLLVILLVTGAYFLPSRYRYPGAQYVPYHYGAPRAR